MNPWNALLESLHSALIDELVERVPEPKPELGLPSRQTGFSLPEPRISEVWSVQVELQGSGRGKILIGLSTGAAAAMGVSAEALFEAVWSRAQRCEFSRRGLQPVIQPGRLQSRADDPEVTRILGFPFRITQEPLWLAVGLY